MLKYATETQPLRELLKKGRKWRWTSIESEAFQKVKRLFAESVLLKQPDYDLPLVMYCDASYLGVSWILTQVDKDGNTYVIAVASRSLSPQETRLFPTEIEVCAVYHGLQKFKDFVFNHEVIVRSDAISLPFMEYCKLNNSRISRFIHEIMSHKVKIEYIPGKQNIFADLLSRLPRNEELRQAINTRENKECIIMRLMTYAELNLAPKFKDIAKLQDEDPIVRTIKESAHSLESENSSKYAVQNGVLYKLCGKDPAVWKTYIPSRMEEEIILSFHHGLAHSGVHKTMLTIEEHLYIKQLGKKARKLVGKCELCQKAKDVHVHYDYESQNILRENPNDLICVDGHGPLITGKYNYRHILVVFDVFSKFIKLYPMRALTTTGCLRRLDEDFIPKYGKMKAILSDNGPAFRSPRWKDHLQGQGIQVLHCSAYRPSANPVERQMKTISTYLRILCHENHKSWVDFCPIIERLMNDTPNPSTQVIPTYIFTGCEPVPLLEGIPTSIATVVKERQKLCEKSFARQVKRAEKRREKTKRYKHKWDPLIGDKVLLKDKTLSSKAKAQTAKMNLRYKGPYVISRVFGNYTYKLSNIKTQKRIRTYHKQVLRQYKE